MKNKVLYTDSRCRCYIEPGSEIRREKTRFEITIAGHYLAYTLIGHPYAPLLNAVCDDEKFSYSEGGKTWFSPDMDWDWGKFCNELADKRQLPPTEVGSLWVVAPLAKSPVATTYPDTDSLRSGPQPGQQRPPS